MRKSESELYQTNKSNISEHIMNIFDEGELEKDAVVRKFRTTAADGKTYLTPHDSLDMIISLNPPSPPDSVSEQHSESKST